MCRLIHWAWITLLVAAVGQTKEDLAKRREGISRQEMAQYRDCIKSGIVVSEAFCLPADYRRDVPPHTHGPLNVFFNIPITEISEVDDHRSQITIRMAYKLRWPEHRMILNESADWSRGEINVRPDMIKHFWTPDIIVHDLIRFTKPEVLSEVAALEIIRDHSIYYKVRSDITVVCKGMQFVQYPLDRHTCYLKFSSFGYDDTQMRLSGKYSYQADHQRILPFHIEYQDLHTSMRTWAGSSSNYSVFGVEIILVRSLSPFILSVYLPSGMFVVMSWVSFFIPPEIVQARIVLLVTLCLVLINMFNSTMSRIPVASSVTAIEVWILACILLVFLSLVEYAVILRRIVATRKKKNKKRAQKVSEVPRSISFGSDYRSSPQQSLSLNKIQRSKSASVLPLTILPPERILIAPTTNESDLESPKGCQRSWDQHSTLLFPLLFSSFNVLYWLYFFSISIYRV